MWPSKQALALMPWHWQHFRWLFYAACGRDNLADFAGVSRLQGELPLFLQVKHLGKSMVDMEPAEAGLSEDLEDFFSSEDEEG